MTALVEGIYRDGKIELLESLPDFREGRVRVVVIEQPETKPEPQYLQFGKYAHLGPDTTTLEDFKEAEWHGEEEFDDLYNADLRREHHQFRPRPDCLVTIRVP